MPTGGVVQRLGDVVDGVVPRRGGDVRLTGAHRADLIVVAAFAHVLGIGRRDRLARPRGIYGQLDGGERLVSAHHRVHQPLREPDGRLLSGECLRAREAQRDQRTFHGLLTYVIANGPMAVTITTVSPFAITK